MTSTSATVSRPRFAPGQIIQHRLFDYRGVIVDVDAECLASPQWYAAVARTRPPRDKPWYHVLVHQGTHMTYVAEQNLVADPNHAPIEHPLLEHYFDDFENGRYARSRAPN